MRVQQDVEPVPKIGIAGTFAVEERQARRAVGLFEGRDKQLLDPLRIGCHGTHSEAFPDWRNWR
jgi:hypothetical protein